MISVQISTIQLTLQNDMCFSSICQVQKEHYEEYLRTHHPIYKILFI